MKTAPVSIIPKQTIVLQQKAKIQNQIEDTIVLTTLQNELSSRMEKPDVNKWMQKIVEICDRTGIAPRKLPVNKDFPGSLTPEENHEIFLSVLDAVV